MEPNGLTAGSSASTGDQSEALNQNRAHREHSGIPRCPADDPGTNSAVHDRGLGVGPEGPVRDKCPLGAG